MTEFKKAVQDRIGKRILVARRERRWSVYRLAVKSGVQATLIFKIEKGKVAPRVDTLHKLCEALDERISFPLTI